MFRKRLFTLDTNYTNAAESKFGVVKDAVENEFNGIYLTSTSSYAFCLIFLMNALRKIISELQRLVYPQISLTQPTAQLYRKQQQ